MTEALKLFLDKVESRNFTVGIIGLGYVGIPLALRCSEAGFRVIGFDVSETRVNQLNSCVSPIKHISSQEISEMIGVGFKATTNFAFVEECDALIICVPTPLNATREPDLSFVIATMDMLAPYIRSGQILSLESTTWPGTTEEILQPYVTAKNLEVGNDFFLVYSPEREDPGNEYFSTQTIPKILGGHTLNCRHAGDKLYGAFIDKIVCVSSTKAAEMVKLLENIHRAVNIGLANEMKIICEEMGLNIFEIVDAAATKPFGFTPYYPGPGIGGHCIPIDPFYLTWKAREYGVKTQFIELAGEINASMPQYVVNKTIVALNEKGIALSRAKVLVLGIAYKRDIDDMRESPSVSVMELLREYGAKISYHDTNVPVFPEMRKHKFNLSSIPLTPETVKSFDVVMLLTDHSDLDYDMIADNSLILIDTRGKYRDVSRQEITRA